MISFIIIGKNEGWKLTKCLESVFKTIKQSNITLYEVIYVDSNSKDDSIGRANAFVRVRIYQITGICNAAIARNIGARESRGDVLFFIDGDMEIMHDFLPLVYDSSSELKYNFVSGNLLNINYDYYGNIVSKQNATYTKIKEKYEVTTGGIFLIKRNLWLRMNGMKTKLVYNEDLDFGIRLAKSENKLYRKKEIIAKHHTIPSNDKNRMWKFLFSKSELYRVVLLRDNFFNVHQWTYFFRGNYTLFMLLFLILVSVQFHCILLVLLYFPLIMIRIISRKEYTMRLIISRIFYFLIYEPALFFAFFLFWPKKNEEKYVCIK
jgi:glycosyltransferase involved in cell wall biosynthesis